uniref:Uncharacterized protein n=1 Tax=Anguilla anguilla TaxID=7936 RepID=A0A0E9RBX7_ANGAN
MLRNPLFVNVLPVWKAKIITSCPLSPTTSKSLL